jgi:hypothetical protein
MVVDVVMEDVTLEVKEDDTSSVLKGKKKLNVHKLTLNEVYEE